MVRSNTTCGDMTNQGLRSASTAPTGWLRRESRRLRMKRAFMVFLRPDATVSGEVPA